MRDMCEEYTVLLAYPEDMQNGDRFQTYCESVRLKVSKGAAEEAVRQVTAKAVAANLIGDEDDDDFCEPEPPEFETLLVFRGGTIVF